MRIKIEGPARLVGSGGADRISQTSYQAKPFRIFNGLGLAIIAATSGPDEISPGSKRKSDEIIVRAHCKSMESVELHLTRTEDGKVKSAPPAPSPSAGSPTEGVDGLPSAK